MKILICSPIDADAVNELSNRHDVAELFSKTDEEAEVLLRDCEVLVFRSGIDISANFMERAPNLKLLVRAGSGVDNIDLSYMRKRGIDLERIPGPGARAVAEMAFAFMLTLSRNLFEADRSMRKGKWIKYELESFLLKNKTLGIVGLGNIGSQVAEMGVAWGMKVIGCIEHPDTERAKEFLEKGIQLVDFDRVVSEADYVSIHVPLKDSTRNLIDADVLSRMKVGSCLINLARGGVVDEQALQAALTSGERLRGAALDVHQQEGAGKFSPLIELPNVILTPHIGGSTIDTQREIGKCIVEIVNDVSKT